MHSPPRAWIRTVPWIFGVVATLLALVGSWRASPTDDEPTYLGQGAYLLRTGDFRAPVLLWQPPLALYVQAAGTPFVDLREDASHLARSRDSLTALGDALIFDSPSPPAAVLRSARVPVALATGVLAVLAAWIAGSLAGLGGACIAGLLVALSPVVYGNGGLATTDAVAALGALAAVAGMLRVLRTPTGRTIVPAGALLGVALLAKHTNVALVPLAAGVACVAARGAGASRWRALLAPAALLSCAAVVVWGGYGFDTAPLVDTDSTGDLARRVGAWLGLPAAWSDFAARVPVPAPRWWQSLVFQASKQHGRLYFRFFDEMSKVGWWSYFPVVTAAKATLGSLALVAIAALSVPLRRPTREEWVLVLAFALPFGAAVVSRHNLGVRHVLPALVPLFVLAGARVAGWLRETRWVHAAAVVVVAAAGVHVAEGLAAARHPVAWWNLAAGGTERGWRISAGSNADWGQGLWELRDIVRERGMQPVHLVPHGPASAIADIDRPPFVLRHSWWAEALPQEGWLAVSTSAPWVRGVPLGDAPEDDFLVGAYRVFRLPLRER